MSKSLTADMPKDEAEVKEALEKMLAEVAHIHETMQRDREEIDRLKAHTRAILTELEA